MALVKDEGIDSEKKKRKEEKKKLEQDKKEAHLRAKREAKEAERRRKEAKNTKKGRKETLMAMDRRDGTHSFRGKIPNIIEETVTYLEKEGTALATNCLLQPCAK